METLCKENTEKVIRLEQDLKSNWRQLDSIVKEQKILHDISSNLKLLEEHNKYQNKKIDEQARAIVEIRDELVKLKTKPLNDARDVQNKIKVAVLCTMITLIVTYFFNRFFML
ncbi:hypothetical protein SH1V18_21080 [Vallitalea longa]|uniref:Uncharacterized protein n=1 Tax=Vallitalea longa TaxID=2936439 RepID=A0A9W6DFN8_9FIRM|nr:hypothetical protein [Vallitalea longa]GKX29628.1 hypothetical protein SH1V18_21080 [Vallitalea longa]